MAMKKRCMASSLGTMGSDLGPEAVIVSGVVESEELFHGDFDAVRGFAVVDYSGASPTDHIAVSQAFQDVGDREIQLLE
nr:hypothetical protein Iba_chr06cCG3000 [Ipomoea batatas]